jgi:hypothetical protein
LISTRCIVKGRGIPASETSSTAAGNDAGQTRQGHTGSAESAAVGSPAIFDPLRCKGNGEGTSDSTAELRGCMQLESKNTNR